MGRHGAVGKMWRRLQLTSMGRLGGGIVQAKHVEDTFGGGFFSIHGRAVRHLRERVGGLCGGKEQAKHVEDILNLDIHGAGSRSAYPTPLRRQSCRWHRSGVGLPFLPVPDTLRSTLQDGCQGFKAWSACM